MKFVILGFKHKMRKHTEMVYIIVVAKMDIYIKLHVHNPIHIIDLYAFIIVNIHYLLPLHIK